MTPDISDLIPVLLVEIDKYIEVVDGHFVKAKKKRKARIKMRDNNGKPFIADLYNVLFSPELNNQLFP